MGTLDKSVGGSLDGAGSKEFESLTTDDARIVDSMSQPGITTVIGDTTSLSNQVGYVDPNVNPGYLFDLSGNNYSTDGGDTWSSTSGLPSGADQIVLAYDGYIYALGENPLSVYRSSYTDSFSGSFSWTQTHTGQTDSEFLVSQGRFANLAVNKTDGTLILAEYGKSNTSFSEDPIIYRSTDAGASFSQVYQDTDSAINHVHAVGHDPYDTGHWIATLGDGADNPFLESTDDGQTWSRVDLGLDASCQAVGLDFGPDYYYFADDNGSFAYGPWVVDRDDYSKKAALCSVHPRQAFSDFTTSTSLQYGIYHDRDAGVTYFDVRNPNRTAGFVVGFVRWVGDDPHLLETDTSTDIYVGPDYVFNKFQRVGKVEYGGV